MAPRPAAGLGGGIGGARGGAAAAGRRRLRPVEALRRAARRAASPAARLIDGAARPSISRRQGERGCSRMIRSFSSRHFFSMSSSSDSRIIVSMPARKWRGHAAGAADPMADRAHHPRQILRADHHQGDERDDQELAGIDAEHGAPSAGGALRLGGRRSGVAPVGACAAAGGAGVGRRRRGARAVDPALAACGARLPRPRLMPFLKLFMPLATSPIMSEKRALAEQQQDDEPHDDANARC